MIGSRTNSSAGAAVISIASNVHAFVYAECTSRGLTAAGNLSAGTNAVYASVVLCADFAVTAGRAVWLTSATAAIDADVT